MKKDPADHQVSVYVANGACEHFTIRELRRLYTSWQFWVLITVGFAIIATGHPATLPNFSSFGLNFAFWWLALAIYMGLSEVYLLTVSRAWQRTVGRPIPLLLMTAPMILFATYSSCFILCTLFHEPRNPFDVVTWQMSLRNLFIAHVFETVALCWLMPVLRDRKAREDRRSVTLAGRRVDLGRIGRVKSAEHYLEVYTDDGVETLRERMATFLEQVRAEDGIQTHRSHWVAAARVAGLKGSELQLDCGNTVPVARGRLDDVRSWVATRLQNGGGGDLAAG